MIDRTEGNDGEMLLTILISRTANRRNGISNDFEVIIVHADTRQITATVSLRIPFHYRRLLEKTQSVLFDVTKQHQDSITLMTNRTLRQLRKSTWG